MALLFDSDSLTAGTDSRGFTVTAASPVLLTAAGLAPGAVIPIYVRGGAPASMTLGCAPSVSDFLWSPLFRCGVAVTLSAENNQRVELTPGVYSLGDPNAPLVVAGDVNVEKQSLQGVAPEVLCCMGKCEAPPPSTAPEILFPVETALAELGCVANASGDVIGKVMLSKTLDEATGVSTIIKVAYFEDGTVQDPYTGPWAVCSPNPCTTLALRGLTATW